MCRTIEILRCGCKSSRFYMVGGTVRHSKETLTLYCKKCVIKEHDSEIAEFILYMNLYRRADVVKCKWCPHGKHKIREIRLKK